MTGQPQQNTGRRTGSRVRALAALACCCLVLFAVALNRRASSATSAVQREFANFSHAVAEHRQDCAACHRRTDNSVEPRLPGHKACTGCHIQQFVTQSIKMCAICHASVESARPPVKPFPSLRSFDVRFDHAQHAQGAARPEQGCAACHTPARRGVAYTIPNGSAAHAQCYQCHTPQAESPAGRAIGACGTCHEQGALTRSSTNARAFSVGFSHAAHGARQRLSCSDCHTARAGVARVTSPRPTQHFGSSRAQSCMTCHNNRRAFGGEDFSDCKRCHKGPTFRM